MGFEYQINCKTEELNIEDFDFSSVASEWDIESNDGQKVIFSLLDSKDDGWNDAILIKESSSLYLLINAGTGNQLDSLVRLVEDFLKHQGIDEFSTEEI